MLFRSDPRVAAVVIATPDHWHARMTTLACEAGKDVYVETPVCHRGGEAAAMIAAARKHQRIVAVGLPQRSGAHFQSAIRLVQSGQLGKVTLAKAWFVQRRQPLTPSVSSEPPVGVDFPSWLGPAPQREFLSNRFHYHWRWFWDFGGGTFTDLMVHWIDVAHWILDLDHPDEAVAIGDSMRPEWRWQTPDTAQCLLRYPKKGVQAYFESTFANARNAAMSCNASSTASSVQ